VRRQVSTAPNKVKGSQVRILSARPDEEPLDLDESPGQAVFRYGVRESSVSTEASAGGSRIAFSGLVAHLTRARSGSAAAPSPQSDESRRPQRAASSAP